MSAASPILSPVFALAGWTGCILLYTAYKRLTGKVSPKEYKLGESDKVPVDVKLANRNYMNLLELPLLFYVVCLMAHVTSAITPSLVTLAWAYVLLRIAHSLVHITYNHILHRFISFAASNFVLIAMWVLLGTAVL